MAISANVLSIGSPATQVHPPSVHSQHITVTNLQPHPNPEDYTRNGYVYLAHATFTLSNSGSTAFAIRTGSHGAQFQFYEIDAESSTVFAELMQGATYGTGGTVLAYNLDRNKSDVYESVLTGANNPSGGTVISTEYVPASNQGGGVFSSVKIHTLKPSTQYVMKFSDYGGQGTEVAFQLAFAEQFNGGHDIWINYGSVTIGSALCLRPQESLTLQVEPLDNLLAISSQPTRLSVLRQVVT